METLQEIISHYQSKEYSKETFNQFYPKGRLTRIKLEQVDKKALQYFENKSKLFVSSEDYKKNNFLKLFRINIENTESFVATQMKMYHNDEAEHLTYLFERNGNETIGHGEIRFNPISPKLYFKDKPFIGWTSTERNFQNQGFGENRVYAFNALSHMIHGLSLHSDTLHCSKNQTKIWEKLERKNEATRYLENGHNRWHFN
ncbi:hypothetical protein KAS08_02140 [Candidatus Pacearchaeota archaeon]|nr:hypothetical protein [Candidatus Pacearchaeota archaeon]